MKVLHINICGNLSTGNIASDIIRTVNSNGGEGVLAYARGNAPDDVKTIRIGGKRDVYLHAFMSRITDRTGFYSKRATKRLITQIVSENPDIIHLHNIHGYYIHIGMLFDYLKTCGKPIVWTQHDCWALTGHCPHFSAQGCDRWKTQCHDCPLRREYPASMCMDRSKRNYRDKKAAFCGVPDMTIVTPSKWLKSVVEESFLKDYPCRVIYNGVNPKIFYPRTGSTFREKYHIGDKKFILGVASTWSKNKGYEDYAALSKLVERDTVLVMIGLSKKQIDGLPDNIIGIGRTDNVEELAQAYSEADYLFNASVEETMGLTTVEAIMCGTPAIVFRATAVPECVDSSTGYVAEPHDVEAVAKIIREIPSKEVGLPENTEFLKAVSCRKYYELYQEILKRA